MNETKVIVSVDIEVKGVKLKLTKTEAVNLLFQLQHAVGIPPPVTPLNLNKYPSIMDKNFGQPQFLPNTSPFRSYEITC